VVEPGGLLAILGGGQLGRMTAMAARTMGYRVRVMDPEAGCPASFVVDEVVVGKWDDVDAARRLAAGADAVTLEIEQIGVAALRKWRIWLPCGLGLSRSGLFRTKSCRKRGWRKMRISGGAVSRGFERGGAGGGCSGAGRAGIFEDGARRL
jgi:5-(carboxyamino)imidazole ribonucleotide synthase